MDSAPFDLGFYIARIHGRAEVPESMVLDENDYALTETPSYLDFVSNCLTRYRCLFIGFSFSDPSVARILNVIRDRLGPAFPELHAAILPIDASADFVSNLEAFNISRCSMMRDLTTSHYGKGLLKHLGDSPTRRSRISQGPQSHLHLHDDILQQPIQEQR
jgi:hypothetical protein